MVKLHYIINGEKIQTFNCCVKIINDQKNRLMVIVSIKEPNVIVFHGHISDKRVNVKRFIKDSNEDFDYVIWKKMYCSSFEITNKEYFKLRNTCYKLTKELPRIKE
tara:strand:- start:157 stop:474 length:318 start_codon:yes stop_codon:yes gene_type:complete